MSFRTLTIGVALASALFATACADFERGPRPPPVVDAGVTRGDSSDAGAIPFATVQPLLDDTCGKCHAPGEMAGNTGLILLGDTMSEYTAVRSFVDPTAPAQSRLLAKASGQGHGGGTIYRAGSAEYMALLSWIESGARL